MSPAEGIVIRPEWEGRESHVKTRANVSYLLQQPIHFSLSAPAAVANCNFPKFDKTFVSALPKKERATSAPLLYRRTIARF